MADDEKNVCVMKGKGKRRIDDYVLMILVESERDPGLEMDESKEGKRSESMFFQR
jgi:hypothetical protein